MIQRAACRQRGASMIVALIMLLLMTLLGLTTYRLGGTSTQVVGNLQQHNQALAAAQSTIEQVFSNGTFPQNPGSALPAPCNGTPNTNCVDVNGDGTADITVQIGSLPASGQMQAAPCVQQVKPMLNSALNLSRPDDAGCAVGVAQSYGVAGANNTMSMCAETLWDIDAVATDATAQATATVSAGIKVRTSTDDVNSTYNCN